MEYHSLNNLNDSDRSSLTSVFQGILTSLKHSSVNKAVSYLRYAGCTIISLKTENYVLLMKRNSIP